MEDLLLKFDVHTNENLKMFCQDHSQLCCSDCVLLYHRLLKDELQHLSESVQGLCDKSKEDIEFIASRKCVDKIHEFESYLHENPVKVPSQIIFQANINLLQYLNSLV
ncbi:hypothetical protein DPMN_033015 [Dreissena polymorpha]|uniref:Uncharacterized protein n=1 Tax=Dreissena polymorpha TaxID=45954 RepID=A0A9D4M5V7_DREPO|nr:hypothetical protein DPMN_033015 [Dreissena polymorpha]